MCCVSMWTKAHQKWNYVAKLKKKETDKGPIAACPKSRGTSRENIPIMGNRRILALMRVGLQVPSPKRCRFEACGEGSETTSFQGLYLNQFFFKKKFISALIPLKKKKLNHSQLSFTLLSHVRRREPSVVHRAAVEANGRRCAKGTF